MTDYWEDNGIEKPQIVIVCAACKFGGVILCGARHWDKVMRKQADLIGFNFLHDCGKEEQGFIDQFGDFHNREESMELVKHSAQTFDIKANRGDEALFSEGLY